MIMEVSIEKVSVRFIEETPLFCGVNTGFLHLDTPICKYFKILFENVGKTVVFVQCSSAGSAD